MLNNKYAEQDTTAQTYKKRIQDNLLRVQGMTQEISSLSNEISERNQTIREKVILLFKESINTFLLFYRLIVLVILN